MRHFSVQTQTETHWLWLVTSDWCIYLNSQIEVLLNEVFIALGPVADAVVHFEHTRFPSKWQGCVTSVQPGPESSSVHSLSKVDLFCDNAEWLFLSKTLLGQEILLEHQLGTLDILLFRVYLDGDSWSRKGGCYQCVNQAAEY